MEEKTTKTKISEDEILERKLRRADEKRKYLLHQKELGKEKKLLKYTGKKIIRETLFKDIDRYSPKTDEGRIAIESIKDVIKTAESHIYESTTEYYKCPLISKYKTAHKIEYTLMMHFIFETIDKYKKLEDITSIGSTTMKKLFFLKEDYKL